MLTEKTHFAPVGWMKDHDKDDHPQSWFFPAQTSPVAGSGQEGVGGTTTDALKEITTDGF